MKALGLDACRGKWLAVVLDEGRFDDARLASDAAALVSAWPDAAAIGVDIPIGLPETPLREADRAAREFVGERRSSVFATFPFGGLGGADLRGSEGDLCRARMAEAEHPELWDEASHL
jgi:Protein of unknown function (DUF429)